MSQRPTPRDPFADNDPMSPPDSAATAAAPPETAGSAATPPPPGRTAAAGGHQCDGGWKTVTVEYVARQVARGGTIPEELLRAQREMLAQRARDTVYPCRECNPDLFFRWVGGHLDPDHEPDDCRDCQQVRSGETRRRRPTSRGHEPAAPPAPRPRADLA